MPSIPVTVPRTRHSPPGSRAIARLALIGAAAAALTVLPALPASAHDELTSATPAAGAVVTAAPADVELTFSGDLLELGGGRNGVQVVDSAGRHYETACSAVDGSSLTAPVALGAGGTYTVDWRAVSGDGHPVSSSYTFTWRPAAGAASSSGSADGPACAGGTGGGSTAAAPVSQASTGLPGGALATGAIGGGVLLAAVAAVVVVVVRLRRAGEQTGTDEREDGR